MKVKEMRVKIYAVLTLLIILLLPTIVRAEENTEVGAWAVVDNTGQVINIEVCSESVCGANGVWQGKVPYCDTCKYVYQLPAESNGNVAGYKDIPYDQNNNTFYAETHKIVNGVKVDYPACNSLDSATNDTKCTISSEVTTKDKGLETKIEVVTFGKYKTFSKVVGKIQVVKQKKQNKTTIIKKKRKVINWSLQSKLKNAYLN